MDMAGRAYFILNIFTILLYNIKYRFDEIDRRKNIGYGQIIITYVIPIFCILYKRAIDLPIFS